MSSLQINDDLENLDSSLIMNQDEQNNAEPGQDSPPTDRDQDKNSIAQNNCILLTNDLNGFWDDDDIFIKCTTHGTSMEQSVHRERKTVGQATDNMSDGDDISVSWLDSEDINDRGMNPVLIHPRIMSTDRSSRSRTLIDPTSPSSRRNLSLRRRRSTPYRYYRREVCDRRYHSYSCEGRDRRHRIDSRESRDRRYRSDSRESRDRRYRSDSRECRDSCYRSDSREDCDRRYRRDSRECCGCCYPCDSLESPECRFCKNSRDRDDQCDLCGNRFSSNVVMLRPYRS